ncbi:MAG TPA: nuclear transport factor 2 family protein [Anaerolineales bacterium]
MKRILFSTLLLTLSLTLTACWGTGPYPAIDPNDPTTTLKGIEAAWNAWDVEAVLTYYAEDATETNGEGTFTGHDKLREVFERVIRHFTMECDNYQVDGDKVTYDCTLKGRKDPNSVLWVVERYDAVLNEEGKLQSNILIETFKP